MVASVGVQRGMTYQYGKYLSRHILPEWQFKIDAQKRAKKICRIGTP
jgi:hypothetical protein